MSKAEAGMKLVRWLPEIAGAWADDIARFGPQARRVRTLLDFIPTMSDEAAKLSDATSLSNDAFNAAGYDAGRAAWDAAREDAQDAAYDAARYAARNGARNAAGNAAWGEVANDLITPDVYRTLTNPLAIGREFDVLRPQSPDNFLDVVRGLGERRLVLQPSDVEAARTLARDPQREALMEFINGMTDGRGYGPGFNSLDELINVARII